MYQGFSILKICIKITEFFNIKEIYLWKDVPDYLLIESGIILSNDLVNIKDKYKTNKYYRNYNVLLDTVSILYLKQMKI